MTTELSDSGVMFADGSRIASARELSHVNDIINGEFRVAQNGTSFPAPVAGSYDLDGWLSDRSGATVFTVAQVAGSSAGRLARRVTITTASGAVGVANAAIDVTLIEGYDIEKYVGNTFTIGFRAMVPVAGIHCVALRSGGGDRAYVKEINFPTANVYQNCSFTVVGGLPTAGTWNYTNGAGMSVNFLHMAGTQFHTTTPEVWTVGSLIATANQVNDCATIGNVWAMEKVTLNLGTVAAVSEITFADDLRKCQRYLPVVAVTEYSYTGMVFTSSNARCFVTFPVQARVPPTGFTVTGAIGMSNAGGGSVGVITFGNASLLSASISAVNLSGLVSGNATSLVCIGMVFVLFTGCRL